MRTLFKLYQFTSVCLSVLFTIETLTQWFLTGMPRNSRVSRDSARGITFIYIYASLNIYGYRQILTWMTKGAARKRMLSNATLTVSAILDI